LIKIDLDGFKVNHELAIACPSFTSDVTHLIYIHDSKLKCTCYAYKFYNARDGGYCKHIKLLAETILKSA
jgi:hypothetical protein